MIDPQRILEKLHQLLTDCQQNLPPGDWHVTINARWRPDDGNYRNQVLFTVSSISEDDDE